MVSLPLGHVAWIWFTLVVFPNLHHDTYAAHAWKKFGLFGEKKIDLYLPSIYANSFNGSNNKNNKNISELPSNISTMKPT